MAIEAPIRIPFNKPYMTGRELAYIAEAHAAGHLAGDGMFSRRCGAWLEQRTGARKALLTHSCTAALEMAAMLADIGPGDEVIMPSFTFVSTANAFVLRGGVPGFVDIRPDTLNLDETLIATAITARTRAICAVHYAGVGADLDAIGAIARKYNLLVLEDAAQGLFACWRGRPLGTIGALGALSFHETKNVISGEGGALLINDPELAGRAETIWEKGTDRARFRRGETSRYTWQTLGSSFAPSEITAAFLWAQLQHGEEITARRRAQWSRYHAAFEDLEQAGLAGRPEIPRECQHNAHLYRLLLPSAKSREETIAELGRAGIQAIFNYVPLHDSPAGLRYGRASGNLRVTRGAAARDR